MMYLKFVYTAGPAFEYTLNASNCDTFAWDCCFLSEVGRVELTHKGRARWVSGIYRILITRDGMETKFLYGELRLKNEDIVRSSKPLKRLLTRSIRYKIYEAAKTL